MKCEKGKASNGLQIKADERDDDLQVGLHVRNRQFCSILERTSADLIPITMICFDARFPRAAIAFSGGNGAWESEGRTILETSGKIARALLT